jgi:hypothetical protein
METDLILIQIPVLIPFLVRGKMDREGRKKADRHKRAALYFTKVKAIHVTGRGGL